MCAHGRILTHDWSEGSPDQVTYVIDFFYVVEVRICIIFFENPLSPFFSIFFFFFA